MSTRLIDQPVFVFEVDLQRLYDEGGAVPKFTEIPRYPAATRDLAFVVDRDTPFGAVQAAIAGFKNPLVESGARSSVYEGDPIPEDKKSVALAISYRSGSGNLTDKKVDAVHSRLAKHLCTSLEADLR